MMPLLTSPAAGYPSGDRQNCKKQVWRAADAMAMEIRTVIEGAHDGKVLCTAYNKAKNELYTGGEDHLIKVRARQDKWLLGGDAKGLCSRSMKGFLSIRQLD